MRKTRGSILSAMPQFDCEGLVEGAVLGEAGVGGGGREEGAPSEPGAGEAEGTRGETAQPSAVASAGLDSESGERAARDQRKRPRSPSSDDGDLIGSFLKISAEKTPVVAATSAGDSRAHRTGTTSASGAASACFAGVRNMSGGKPFWH